MIVMRTELCEVNKGFSKTTETEIVNAEQNWQNKVLSKLQCCKCVLEISYARWLKNLELLRI